MDKIKEKTKSLKWSFILYLPICLIVSILGAFAVGIFTNYAQEWYRNAYSDVYAALDSETLYEYEHGYKIEILPDGKVSYSSLKGKLKGKHAVIYWIISYAQVVLIPFWVILCILITGIIFYNRELKKPINVLLNASKKISENQLDFKIERQKNNELGMLCKAFEDMRQNLYDSNLEMWQSLEERKRLNSAFSHDLRTPLTVLRGYVDFMQKYSDKITPKKQEEILSMMSGQIVRLEHYTQKMNSVQKLEDIKPKRQNVPSEQIKKAIFDCGKAICKDKNFTLDFECVSDYVFIDYELLMQIFENLISNAYRYAENAVWTKCSETAEFFVLSVYDDGKGFTKQALENASKPFFRDEKESQTHFGLGLYICRILCEKCGGSLLIENHENGGKVKAEILK